MIRNVAAAVLCATFAAPGPIRAQDEASRLMGELMSGKSAVGTDFVLPDTTGRARSLAEFRGKVVLLYFGYLGCPDVCPTDLAQIARAMRSLGSEADGVQPLFVTLDPVHDAPAAIAAYVAAFHPRIVALRGTEEETRRVARAFKVYYEKRPDGTLDHAAFTFVLDRSGRYVSFFPPGTTAPRMTQMLREQAVLQR